MQLRMTSQNQKRGSARFSMRKAAWTMAASLMVLSTASRLSADALPHPGVVPLWTCDMVTDEFTNVVRELKPIKLVGARNGSFSAKVVVESGTAITGVQASVSALTGMGSTIPAQNVQLRYGKAWDGISHLYGCPNGPDVLLESPPTNVAPYYWRAVCAVWVTVKVPKDAKAGMYTGHVTVQGVEVPLNLDVQNWTLPDHQDYRMLTDFVESPDTLAVEYNVPLWSEKHWKMIDRAFQILGSCGGSTLYIPLIARTNLGNEQSMVRWIPRGENKYDYDYTVMDRYLDSAVKNMGKPKIVVFYVWDVCMSADSLTKGLWLGEYADKQVPSAKDTLRIRKELLGKGPRVTALDPVTKEASVLILPRYENPESQDLWKPLFAEIRKRMEKRGLDKTMMLGLMPDEWPSKEEVTAWKSISGGLPWAIHGHAGARESVLAGKKGLYNIADIGYAAFVYNLVYNVNPDKGRMYGWREPGLLTCYNRAGQMNIVSSSFMRETPAFAITGGQRGSGRIGAEYWPAVRNSSGKRTGKVIARYPENNWRNLDFEDFLLAPGPDGPVSTKRLESMSEGLQVCEARIFLEDALLDGVKKAKLGADLAMRCQDALDVHHRAMWKTVWSNDEDLSVVGKAGSGRSPGEGLVLELKKLGKTQLRGDEEARKGPEQFMIGWQDREKKLFALSGEVATKLNIPK